MGVPRGGDLVTAALSPGLSWLIFGGWIVAVVLVVAFFMGATRKAREHEERMSERWLQEWDRLHREGRP